MTRIRPSIFRAIVDVKAPMRWEPSGFRGGSSNPAVELGVALHLKRSAVCFQIMCSRYQTPEAAEMARYYRIDKLNLGEFKPVIYPGYQTPVLLNAIGDQVEIESRFWGFVLNMPGKRDPSQLVSKILQNAVSETVHEKRTFSKSWLAGQRCILPAVTFFEPVGGEFKSIYDPERPIISIAGIWAEQTYKDKKIQACTMLTTEPSGWMSEYHDRMPVILHPDDISEWLSPDTAPDQAQKLCRPWSGELTFAN